MQTELGTPCEEAQPVGHRGWRGWLSGGTLGLLGLALAGGWQAAWFRDRPVQAGATPLPAVSRPVLEQATAQTEAGYQDVTGQFVYDGPVPSPTWLVKKGDGTAKDPAVCAAADLPSEALLVDPATKGIANIFVYLAKAAEVHPDRKKSAVAEVVFDQQGCRFEPHAMLVRTDQTVRLKSDDPIAHNSHTYPIRNPAINVLIAPKDRTGLATTLKVPENLPFEVKCDIHPWMRAYWLVLDHPYAAVTDAQGRFKIEKLPVGSYEFRVWHERAGYVDRKFAVTIAAGKPTELQPVLLAPGKFTP